MRYRPMGRTGVKVSVLGFGCMRLPTVSGRRSFHGRVDEPEAQRILRQAFDHGVNYFDTAYNYHAGRSESILGGFQADVGREGLLIATKLPGWHVKRASDFRRIFNVQLRRLKTDHIDFYLLHGLGGSSFERLRQMRVLDFVADLKREGRIRFAGFSFHDEAAAFRPIVHAFDWDMCQIQYNFIDEKYQAGRAGLRHAARRGLGVVVMEPLRGGDLVGFMPDSVKSVWDRAGRTRASAEVCLSWLWDQPEVSTVLSGMSASDQLLQNISTASRAAPGMLSDSDRRLVSRVRTAYARLPVIPCTRCGYCMPCPFGVAIPANFEAYNTGVLFPGSGRAGMLYNTWMKKEQRASACRACGRCEERCPQKLQVRELMKKVAGSLERRR